MKLSPINLQVGLRDGRIELTWPSGVSKNQPFYISDHEFTSLENEVIWDHTTSIHLMFHKIAMRSDAWRIAKLFWWVLLRLQWTGKYFVYFIVHIAEIWGLAKVPIGSEPSLKHIGIGRK